MWQARTSLDSGGRGACLAAGKRSDLLVCQVPGYERLGREGAALDLRYAKDAPLAPIPQAPPPRQDDLVHLPDYLSVETVSGKA